MRTQLKKPLVIFALSSLLIALPLFLLPLNLFNGEIIYQRALVEQKVAAPLSLSYFIGVGYDQKDMVGVKEFYLVKDLSHSNYSKFDNSNFWSLIYKSSISISSIIYVESSSSIFKRFYLSCLISS